MHKLQVTFEQVWKPVSSDKQLYIGERFVRKKVSNETKQDPGFLWQKDKYAVTNCNMIDSNVELQITAQSREQ